MVISLHTRTALRREGHWWWRAPLKLGRDWTSVPSGLDYWVIFKPVSAYRYPR